MKRAALVALLFAAWCQPGNAQQPQHGFDYFVNNLQAVTPNASDYLYVLHNGGSAKIAINQLPYQYNQPCGASGGAAAYFPAANNIVGCSSGVLMSNNSLMLQPGVTLTLPDNSTWTSSGLKSASNILAQQSPSSVPSSICSTDSYAAAFNCDLSHLPFGIGVNITGIATLGEPASGYQFTPNLSPVYTYLSNSSGWNQDTADNGGRTGAVAFYTKVDNYGQGDTGGYFANVFVDSAKAGATSFLANPAGQQFSGQTLAGQSGVFLQGVGDINLTDNGYDVAAVTLSSNLKRTNATGALGVGWMGVRLQSIGSASVDAGFTLSGPYNIGLDLVDASYGTNEAAIAMGGNQRIYLNSTTGTNNYPWNVSLGTTWLQYSSSNTGIFGAVNNGSAFLFGSGTGVNSFIYAGLQVGVNSTNRVQIAGSSTTNPVVISSVGGDTNINMEFVAKGAGGFTFNSGAAITSIGPNGGTNPSLSVDATAANSATGLYVAASAAGSGLNVRVSSSAGSENLTINALGSGTISLGNGSTGNINIDRAAVFSGPIKVSSLQSGTPATYACFDSSGNLISSGSAC